MVKGAQVSEERTAAVSYVLTFYQDVVTLTHWYANYENLLIEMETRQKEEKEKITEDEQETLKTWCQTIRYYARVSYIHYVGIIRGVGEQVNPKITKAFKLIKDQYVIKRVDIEEYVTLLNSVLVHKIIKNLLETSNALVQQLYGEDDTKRE